MKPLHRCESIIFRTDQTPRSEGRARMTSLTRACHCQMSASARRALEPTNKGAWMIDGPTWVEGCGIIVVAS